MLVEMGAVREAEALLAELGVGNENLDIMRTLAHLRISTLVGHFEKTEALTAEILATARRVNHVAAECWAHAFRAHVRWITAHEVTHPGSLEEDRIVARAPTRGLLDAIEWARAMRANTSFSGARPPSDVDVIDAAAFALMAESTEALLADRLADAEERARRAVGLSKSNGMLFCAAEALLLLADVLLASGRIDAVAFVANELANMGATFPSPRLEAEAHITRVLAGLSPLEVLAIEQIARDANVAPAGSRRARALLGVQGPLDRVDQLVLAACAPLHDRIATVNQPLHPLLPSWGLDIANESLWANGKTVRLPALSMQILVALARAARTKEELAREVWSVREYHPLRDDKRLQVAVFRLRHTIELDPKTPRRIVATQVGYAIGDEEPMRVRLSSASEERPRR